MLKQHLDGISFRSLANLYNISPTTAYRKCSKELESLPHCADLTRKYCSRFSGILLVDGKFIRVKPYKYKIPVIYGIDYQTHDIPTFTLASSENFLTLKKFFSSLRLLNYPLQSLVSDENLNIHKACKVIYPNSFWQLCTNHLKENIRNSLNSRSDPTYKPFVKQLEFLFSAKRSENEFNSIAKNILNKFKHDPLCVSVLVDIYNKKQNLFTHVDVKNTPLTNNLIESYNSHLEARVRPLKGFESFKHANLWLNAYFIRRRLRVFTDCRGKFKRLNGKCSMQFSLKQGAKLPNILT